MQLKVKQILKEKGMRMTELAAKLGVDQSNLSKSLEGNPTLSRLEEIAKVVGVPVRELLPDAPPTKPAGVLTMGDKRFALVSLPDECPSTPVIPPDALNFTPDALKEKICILVRQCNHDGRTRALFGFLSGRPIVVLYDGASERYLTLVWDDDGEVSHLDYPRYVTDDEDAGEWDERQLAELMLNDII